jgi:hypothetical protein
MKRFPSLEKFLLLLDPDYSGEVSAHHIALNGPSWVRYYRCAKANWEKFGDEGPPAGTLVVMLKPGHGGLEGVRRTVKGITENGRYIEVTRPARWRDSERTESSLASAKHWWLDMSIPDLVPFQNGHSW